MLDYGPEFQVLRNYGGSLEGILSHLSNCVNPFRGSKNKFQPVEYG